MTAMLTAIQSFKVIFSFKSKLDIAERKIQPPVIIGYCKEGCKSFKESNKNKFATPFINPPIPAQGDAFA